MEKFLLSIQFGPTTLSENIIHWNDILNSIKTNSPKFIKNKKLDNLTGIFLLSPISDDNKMNSRNKNG